MANCQKAERISASIAEALAEAKCEEDDKKIAWCIEYLDKLRSLARRKIKEITLYILENIEKYLLKSEKEKAAAAAELASKSEVFGQKHSRKLKK